MLIKDKKLLIYALSIVFSLKWKNILRFFENLAPYIPLRTILSAKSTDGTKYKQHMSDRMQRAFTVHERVRMWIRNLVYVLYYTV